MCKRPEDGGQYAGITEKVYKDGSINRIKRSIERSLNGWGGETSLTLDIRDLTQEIVLVAMNFNGVQSSGFPLDELKRMKVLLNSFDEI